MRIPFKRSLLLGLAFAATLGSVGLAQSPGVNNNWPIMWSFMGERSTYKSTYTATELMSPASSAKAIFQINGSASKLIRIRRVYISGSVPATALAEPLYFNKVSTAMPATGNSSLLTVVPLDSTNSTATAAVEAFSSNPTDPTLVGEIMAPIVRFLPNSTSNPAQVFMFGELGSSIILRGAAEGLSLNLAAITTSSVLNITVEWTEE